MIYVVLLAFLSLVLLLFIIINIIIILELLFIYFFFLMRKDVGKVDFVGKWYFQPVLLPVYIRKMIVL